MSGRFNRLVPVDNHHALLQFIVMQTFVTGQSGAAARFLSIALSFSSQMRRVLRNAATDQVSVLGWQVLEYLEESEAASVPQIARNRSSSRQNIQVIVDQLRTGGWIAAQQNPSHKRSPLFRITEAGKSILRGARSPELTVLEILTQAASADELEQLTTTLSRLETALATSAGRGQLAAASAQRDSGEVATTLSERPQPEPLAETENELPVNLL